MKTSRSRHISCTLPDSLSSFALLSGASPQLVRRAVLFVHGFNGSAISTWADFVGLVDNERTDAWWETVDLYFFNYTGASVFEQVSRNTVTLYDFIDTIWPNPFRALGKSFGAAMRSEFEYDCLTIVGHSEGGLLARKVILEAARNDERLEAFRMLHRQGSDIEPEPTGILKAELRLFAPAIAGDALSGILGIIARLPIISGVVCGSAAKHGLSAESPSVSAARRETEAYTDFLSMGCFRAHILWPDHDAIVTNEAYQRDRVCRNRPPSTEHTTVCKPTLSYLLPLSFVQRGVIDGECC